MPATAATDPENGTHTVLGGRAESIQDIAVFAIDKESKRVDPKVKLGVHIKLMWSGVLSDYRGRRFGPLRFACHRAAQRIQEPQLVRALHHARRQAN